MEADQVDELRDKLGIKVSGPSPPKPVSSFAHLSLDEGLLKVIWEMEYTQPTPIQELASLTKNFSVVELAALVQAAFSRRLFRSIKISTKEEDEFETFPDIDIDNVSVTRGDLFDVLLEPDKVEVEFEIDQDGVNNILTMEDFKDALDYDVKPALGYDYHLINQYQEGGIIEWCEEITIIIKTGENLIKEVKNASHASLVTVLLEGEPGAGKTELAAYIAKSSNFSYIKVCDSENMGRLIQDNRRRAIKK
ncbi:hypothetical protein QYM36_009423, partial [Artemia franciscana]